MEEQALRYLDRFDASAARLTRVLSCAVQKRARAEGFDPAPLLTFIPELVARYTASGLLDDRRFAHNLGRSLVERGASRAKIRAKLGERGIAPTTIEQVLAELVPDADTELEAARALVRRRRLGSERQRAATDPDVRRDLAVLARAGFSYEIARRALAVPNPPDTDEF